MHRYDVFTDNDIYSPKCSSSVVNGAIVCARSVQGPEEMLQLALPLTIFHRTFHSPVFRFRRRETQD